MLGATCRRVRESYVLITDPSLLKGIFLWPNLYKWRIFRNWYKWPFIKTKEGKNKQSKKD